jgi:hypothetical protein
VVRTEALFGRAVPVPREALSAGPGGELRLAYTAAELAEFPDFAARGAADEGPPPALTPPGSAPGGGAEVGAALARGREAAIGAGDGVLGADGAPAGAVAGLAFDVEDGRLTELVVRPAGGGEPVALAPGLIARLEEGLVVLSITADLVRRPQDPGDPPRAGGLEATV